LCNEKMVKLWFMVIPWSWDSKNHGYLNSYEHGLIFQCGYPLVN
jgi:hypothetical protein